MAARPSRLDFALELAVVSALLLLVALCAAHPIFSVDFHWHLKLGDVIRARGEIPRVDLFSAVHPERPHVQFQWLWDVAASLVYGAGGFTAIRIAQVVLFLLSFGCLYAVGRRQLGSAWLSLLLSALALALFEDRMRARPDALTLGAVVALLPLLLGGYRGAGLRTVAYAFVLACAWSNLHGGASLLLPLSFGALVVGAFLDRRSGERGPGGPALRPALWLLGSGIAGLLLSPTFLAGTLDWLTAVRPQIAAGNEEWRPSYTMLRNGLHPAFIVIGLGPSVVLALYVVEQVARYRARGRAALDAGELLLSLGYLALAHHAVRNAFLCVVPLAFLLRRHRAAIERPAGRVSVVAAALVLMAVVFDDAIRVGYGGVESARELLAYDLAPATYPVELGDFLKEAGIAGGVLNDGRWGGYLIWKAFPACGLFVDTRHHLTPEMWRVFRASHAPLERDRAAQYAFHRWGLELTAFAAPTFSPIQPAQQWALLYKAGDQELYQHLEGSHAAENVERARRWARARGLTPPRDPREPAFAEAMTRAGAELWLRAAYQRRRLARAAAAIASHDAKHRTAGHRARGRLFFQAGDYARALPDLARAAALDASDPRAAYYRALSLFALGRRVEAEQALHDASLRPPVVARLSPVQRAYLEQLAASLVGSRSRVELN